MELYRSLTQYEINKMNLKKRFDYKIHNEQGAAVVEFALLLPILMLIIIGILTFGIVFNSYLQITHAAREGVRWAVLGASHGDITSKAKNSAPGIDWSSATIEITGVPAGGAQVEDQGNEAAVKVTYPLPSIVKDLGSGFFGGSFPSQIASKATQRVE